jgi:hypothetical protein
MSAIDSICDALTTRLEASRKRRAAFERMGNDDAVRLMEGEVELIKSIADEVLAIAVREHSEARVGDVSINTREVA